MWCLADHFLLVRSGRRSWRGQTQAAKMSYSRVESLSMNGRIEPRLIRERKSSGPSICYARLILEFCQYEMPGCKLQTTLNSSSIDVCQNQGRSCTDSPTSLSPKRDLSFFLPCWLWFVGHGLKRTDRSPCKPPTLLLHDFPDERLR